MTLTANDITSFMELYEKIYKKKLTRTEAYKQVSDLLWLVDLMYKPMTRAQHRKYCGALKK
jgi:hypothetical protein